MKHSFLVFCFALVACQVNLVSPRSRDGNSNIRVVGSTAGVNPCGNGTDGELRASRTPVGVYWHGGNATNISINFGNVASFWSMSIIPYNNYTGTIAPNSTFIPLPIASTPVPLRSDTLINLTTNGNLSYVLQNFQWPVEAAGACRPSYYGCALQIRVTNLPYANDTYFTCSDIRVYSHAYDSSLQFTAQMNTGVVAPAPATMLSRLIGVYGTKGLTANNAKIFPSNGAFPLRSDKSFTFTVVVSDSPNFNSEQVTAAVAADASTSLVTTLGVATVVLGTPPAAESSSAGATAAIVIIILLLIAIIGGLVFVKLKKPALWKSWCDSLSRCVASCKPAKGTNI